MEAFLILDSKLSKTMKKTVKKINDSYDDKLFILTEKDLYYTLRENFSNNKYVLIDLFADISSTEKVELTNIVVEQMLSINSKLNINECNLPEITINSIYDNGVSIIYNFIQQLEQAIKEYKITTLNLYYGNPQVQYLGIVLAEGERAFRFLYKRSWYLNYFANEVFKSKVIITWRKKDSLILLNFFKQIKLFSILVGKIALLIKRILKTKRMNSIAYTEKPKALIMVRNPIQVEPLIPIYNEFEKSDKIEPIYLALENYSNNRLNSSLYKNNLRYIDLYSLVKFRDILKIIQILVSIIKTRINKMLVNIDLNINNNKISISYNELIRELSIFWFDALLLKNALDKLDYNNKSIKCLINNETHGYYSAVQGQWAKKNNILSVGIQHVSIADKLKPKISRVETMFMMSKEIANKLSRIKPDEKFKFVGPMAYDMYFNTTNHKGNLEAISIFTQPDGYRDEYIKIIEDVLDIRNKYNLNLDINIKLHPREKNIKIFKQFEENYNKVKVIIDEISSSELVKMSNLIISIHSGVLMQSIIIGTPSISINYDKRHNIRYDFINDEVTKKVFSKHDLEWCITNFDKLDLDYYNNRCIYISSKLDGYDGNASKKIYNYILENIDIYNEEEDKNYYEY